MTTIYVKHENTRQSGEQIRTATVAHPFFRMPQIQGPGLYVNRYEAEAEVGGEAVKIKIGSLTDHPVRHNPVLSDAIRKKVVARVREGQR